MDLAPGPTHGHPTTTAPASNGHLRHPGAPPLPQPASTPDRTEEEIGAVLLQAQRYAEETVQRADEQAQAMVRAAHAEAARIVEAARQQSPAQASAPTGPPDVIAELINSVQAFTQTNTILVQHLEQLCRAVGAEGQVVPGPTAPR